MVALWVKDLVEKEFKCTMAVGKTLRHPDGRLVKITDGKFWGEHGVSNFWYWREVSSDGNFIGPEEHGYGW